MYCGNFFILERNPLTFVDKILKKGYMDKKPNYNKLIKNSTKVLIILSIIIPVVVILYFPKGSWLIGKQFGEYSAITFLVVVLPGLIKRLSLKGKWLKVSSMIQYSRSQIGILMCTLVIGHYVMAPFWNILRPKLIARETPTPELYILVGLAAMWLSIPLALTSNIQSRKWLRGKWNKLHSIVYVMLWLIFSHIVLIAVTKGSFAPVVILYLAYIPFEIYSQYLSFKNKKIVLVS